MENCRKKGGRLCGKEEKFVPRGKTKEKSLCEEEKTYLKLFSIAVLAEQKKECESRRDRKVKEGKMNKSQVAGVLLLLAVAAGKFCFIFRSLLSRSLFFYVFRASPFSLLLNNETRLSISYTIIMLLRAKEFACVSS